MAIVEINLNPSKSELRWFGLLLFLFFALIGGLVFWRLGSLAVPSVLWLAGAVLGLVYYAVRPLRRPMYLGWMYAVYPLGWTISHLLFGCIYFLVMTPIGLLMRLSGRDPLERRFDPEAGTYWVERPARVEPSRYFRQF